MKYKNIFITGSTGVVGKPLLKKLIENGHHVYALSRSEENKKILESKGCLLYTSPSPRDKRQSRMPSSA